MKHSRLRKVLVQLLAYASVLALSNCDTEYHSREWREYLGGADRNHYSPLDQIHTGNVNELELAWEYHTKDSGEVQCNPLIIDGVLYGVSSSNQVFALDAATGNEIWTFLPDGIAKERKRGVAYWQDGDDKRILVTFASWLYALDARTGMPVTSFGDGGRASLKSGLGPTAEEKWVVSTTPGTIFENLIFMPIRVQENETAALGNIQAFDIRTGKLAWIFHTIPHPGEFGHDTWPAEAYRNEWIGAANNWAGMSIDHERGILYVPTGSAGHDFYGGNRKGANLFANTLLALDARTGKRIWHYQFVHHDILDRDLPAPPNLVTINKDGRRIDAVAQITKSGHIFVFNRETGEPVFSIDEVPVPASDLDGEEAWPTQPVPRLPVPFSRQDLTEADINPYSEDRDSLLMVFRNARKGRYMPLSENPTILFPGVDGGGEWGGAAVDPHGIMYVNANEMAWVFTMSRNEKENELAQLTPGQLVYARNCSTCHGKDRRGNPGSGYPSLIKLGERLEKGYVSGLITNGKGRMPGFTMLTSLEKQTLLAHLFGEEKVEGPAFQKDLKTSPLPYRFNGYIKFIDSQGYPAISPPWGTLNAIDLNTGELVWRTVLGDMKELSDTGIPPTGTENYGGPIITAGGLLFIAATKDETFRAYDKNTGKLLWKTRLPASGFATPSTYAVNGKQYVVIACGGGKLGSRKGDSYVAFALK